VSEAGEREEAGGRCGWRPAPVCASAGEVVVTNSIESRTSARRMATRGHLWVWAWVMVGAGEDGDTAGRKVALGEGGRLDDVHHGELAGVVGGGRDEGRGEQSGVLLLLHLHLLHISPSDDLRPGRICIGEGGASEGRIGGECSSGSGECTCVDRG
jgi:hypothetical protein